MFIATIAFIAGLYVKVIMLILPKLTLKDFGKFTTAVGLHFYIFLRIFAEELSVTRGLLFSSLVFIIVASILFKEKLLPRVTEGTLLLYSLIALWVCFETSFYNTSLGLIFTILISFFSLILLNYCIFNISMDSRTQIVFVILFLFYNIGVTIFFLILGDSLEYFKVGYEFSYTAILNVMMLGFMLFQVASNILYVLAMVPLPSKNQTLQTRIQEVKKHAEKLRSAYIDTDLSAIRTMVIVALFLMLCFNTFLSLGFDSILLVIFVLFIGTWIADDYTNQQSETHKTIGENSESSFKSKIILTVALIILFILPFAMFKLTRGVDLSILDEPIFDKSTTVSYPAPVLLGTAVSPQVQEANMLVEKGLTAYYEKNYIDAEGYFTRALQLDSENKYAHNNLGLSYLFQEKYTEAEKEFLKAIEIDVNYANPYNNLGRFYYSRREYETAISYLNLAIKLSPRAQTYINLGDVYATNSNDVEALIAYKKSKELDPTNNDIDKLIQMTENRLKYK